MAVKKDLKKQKSTFFYKLISFILVMCSVIAAGVVVYFEILPYKYLLPLLVIITLLVGWISYKLNRKSCLFTKLCLIFLSLGIIAFESLGVCYAYGTASFLNNILDSGQHQEIFNLYVLDDGTKTSLDALANQNILVYQSDGEALSKAEKALKEKLNYIAQPVDELGASVQKLIDKESEAFFISEVLMQIYKEDHEELYNQLKIIDSVEVSIKKDSTLKKVDIAKQPFVVYLSGTDDYGGVKKVARSDTNMLAVVNPARGKILIINTPRDYYVTLASKNAKDKLTHAGIYGIEESANTLGLLYEVEVNYYARVNFSSFTKIIDALGGIEVESKYNFSYNGYSFKKGKNNLKGNAALAFSRGRKMLPLGDEDRGQNQQAVLAGIIKKLTDKKILTKYNTLLNSLEKGLITNVERDVITQAVNMQLDENIKWEIETYAVTGSHSNNVTYSTGRNKCYVMEPNMETVTEAKAKIQNVLGI